MPDFPSLATARFNTIGEDTVNSTGTTITGAASANTKGSYVELSASTSLEADGFLLQLTFNQSSSWNDYLVDVAVGAASSEVNIVDNMIGYRGAVFNANQAYIPIRIPKGSRVSARMQSGQASESCRVSLVTFSGGLMFPVLGSDMITYGANTADSGGTSIDPGGSADTKGSWTEITSSSAALSGFLVGIGNQDNQTRTTCTWLIDIGLGGAGSEVVIFPDIQASTSSGSDITMPMTSAYAARRVPSGTRIAARAQCSITDATDRTLDILVYGVQ